MPADQPSPRATTGGGVLHPATEGILDAAAEFLWSSEMEESLEAFSSNHAEMFAGAAGGVEGEHRLEWTQAHNDFIALFEHQLEQFVAGQSFTQEEFVAACEDALDQGADQTRASSYEAYAAVHCASIVEMVLMTSTYEFFVKMMLVAAADREPAPAPEPEAQRDDGDDDEGGAE